MKKISLVLITIMLFACNGEDVPDCFQNSGDIIEKEFIVEAFTKISTFPKIELIVTDAPTQRVMVQTGEYLMNDIDVRVVDGRLELYNNNSCNFSRDYGITKVFVSAPNITELVNGSGSVIRSDGVLSYESLRLISEDFNTQDILNINGSFELDIDCNNLNIAVNGISSTVVRGAVDNVFLGYYAGDARFDGRNLIAQNVDIFQRSSNDLIVNAQQSIAGEIRSTGDVILVNTPPVVEVLQYYTGQLIFE